MYAPFGVLIEMHCQYKHILMDSLFFKTNADVNSSHSFKKLLVHPDVSKSFSSEYISKNYSLEFACFTGNTPATLHLLPLWEN